MVVAIKITDKGGEQEMIVKVAPVGERVIEVNTVNGGSIADVLAIAEVSVNGRTILLNNREATEQTPIMKEGDIIVLAPKMKGGR